MACMTASLLACAENAEDIYTTQKDGRPVQLRAGIAKDKIVGERTYLVTVRRAGKTVFDAPCTLDGTEFFAKFTAPQPLNIPSFGPNSHPVRLTCIVDGTSHEQTYPVINLSARARASNAEFAGALVVRTDALSPLWSLGKGKAQEGDAYGYPHLWLDL